MTAPTTSPPDDQFMSAGDMAARMRAFDGATSSVGPPSTWPHSLTTAVRIILGSPHPMFLWWGPELANFYNDGYAVMLGKRHPSALGRPAKQVWTEIWPDLAPLIESVLVRGEGTWRENFPLIVERNGYPEEAFFTFSYSPAPDDDGHIGGLFCAVTEETQRVLAERRLRTLRDLANAPAIHVAEACELALNTLDPRDVPFAATYLFEARGPRATCCARVGSARTRSPRSS